MPLLNVHEAAKQSGVSKSLIYELCRSGLLIHYRVGGKGKRGRVLIDTDDLSEYLGSCKVEEERIAEEPLRHIK
jgi:excisionase family DNA binding protein